jgi:hypothetical protein
VVEESDPRGLSTTSEVGAIIESAAEEMRLKVGDRFWYVCPDLERPEKIGIRVASIWRARDPANGAYWATTLPDVTYQYTLFASEEDLVGRVLPAFPEHPPLKESTWYLVFGEGSLHADQLDRVRVGFSDLAHDVGRLLPDVKLDRLRRRLRLLQPPVRDDPDAAAHHERVSPRSRSTTSSSLSRW